MSFRGHPKTIWVLAAGGGVSAIGASMVIPLPTLFLTERHDLALGVLLHGLGLLLVAGATTTALVGALIVVFTLGEMLLAPTGEALAANFAPQGSRGRYMGVFMFAGTIGFAVGPVAGGLLIDHGLGDWLWAGAFVASIAAASAFLRLPIQKARPRPDTGVALSHSESASL